MAGIINQKPKSPINAIDQRLINRGQSGGNMANILKNHPLLQKHINQAGGMSSMGSPPTVAPPPAAPNLGAGPSAGATPAAAPAGPPPTYDAALTSAFGQGQPFGMRGNYQDANNPMYAGAQRAMQQAMAQIRARFAGGGMGNSSREALAEGEQVGAFGGQMATIGENAYQNDAGRGLQALLGAGSQQLQGQQIAQGGINQLLGAGTQLNQMGVNEQSIPGLQAILSLLGLFGTSSGSGTSSQQGTTSSGFLSY
jgi:hypothetical protein